VLARVGKDLLPTAQPHEFVTAFYFAAPEKSNTSWLSRRLAAISQYWNRWFEALRNVACQRKGYLGYLRGSRLALGAVG